MLRILLTTVVALLLAAPAVGVDLGGTWHLGSYNKDSIAAKADAERWEDRVWVFTKEGDRLRWTDYPIIALSDESGRFERSGGQYSRVLAYWTPNSGQQAELAAGPKVNSRGAKNKSMRGSDAAGWKSASPRAARSASFITYEERWSIEMVDGVPVFTRDDVLGGAMAEEAEGRTRWSGQQSAAAGELTGLYDRDGTRTGTFSMRRVGNVRFLDKKGPSPNEKRAERAREEFNPEDWK